MSATQASDPVTRPYPLGHHRYRVRVDRRTVTLADIVAGRVPIDLTAVRWGDGTVECRANVLAPDYAERMIDVDRPPTDRAAVLTDPRASCDRCADKCG